MKITAVSSSRAGSLLREFGNTVWHTQFAIKSPQCKLFAKIKDINVVYAVAHLTALRKFTGTNNIIVRLSRVDGGTKLTADIRGYDVLISNVQGLMSENEEGTLLHFLFLGIVRSLKGKLTIESMGRGKSCYFESNGFHEDHFLPHASASGTFITAFIPAF